jgi:DNA-binding transcriptional ArsR family regulator
VDRRIADVETLKALSDPLRLRILELMTAGAAETFTVKRLAADIGVGPTKLYHHVNLLAERGLIRPAGTRLVSGIIETSYRIAQLNLSLDRNLLAPDSPQLHDVLTTVFESATYDIERGLRAGTISAEQDADPVHKLTMAKGLARLSPARAAEFQARLRSLFEEFDGGDPNDNAYGLVVALYPMTEIEYPEGAES